MEDGVLTLVKQLEKELGHAVQLVIESPHDPSDAVDETQEVMASPFLSRRVYGGLAERPCVVRPLPTADVFMNYDALQVAGVYGSFNALEEHIAQIPLVTSYCKARCGTFFDIALRAHLAEKYTIKETMVDGWAGQFPWLTVDGDVADLWDWERYRPDLYQESVQFLVDNNYPLLQKPVIATPSGIFRYHSTGFSQLLERQELTEKVADVIFDCL